MPKTVKCVLINVDVVLITEIINIETDTDDMSGASCKLINPFLLDRKSTPLNSSHTDISRMPSSA